MNNLAFSDEVYPEGIVTFEENLKVILTSKTYKEFQRIGNDKILISSKDKVPRLKLKLKKSFKDYNKERTKVELAISGLRNSFKENRQRRTF